MTEDILLNQHLPLFLLSLYLWIFAVLVIIVLWRLANLMTMLLLPFVSWA